MENIQTPSEEERRKIEARLREHNRKVLAEAFSPDNQWFTGEEVRHTPNHLELVSHWQAFAPEEKNFQG